MARRLLASLFVFLVGSALAAESGKELARKKRSLQSSPESSDYSSGKRAKSGLSIADLDDKFVVASKKFLSLCTATETEFIRSVHDRELTPHHTHQKRQGEAFTFRSESPEEHSLIAQHDDEVEEEDIITPQPQVIDTEKAKWRRGFFLAVQANDATRLNQLKPEFSDADFPIYSPINPQEFTYPLHFALRHSLREAASYLIEEGLFDAWAKDSYGHTALSLTIDLGDYRNFSDLLDVSDIHGRVRHGLNLTHLAASSDTISPIFLKALQVKGADFMTTCRRRNWTPLQYAAAANNPILLRWINDNTPCKVTSEQNKTIVLDALKEGHESLALELISMGGRIDVLDRHNRNIFHIIAKKNYRDILDAIKIDFDKGPEMMKMRDSVKGYCPAHYAAEKNHSDILLWIYEEYNLSVKTRDGFSVIQVAINAGSTEVVQVMLDSNIFDWQESFGTEYPPILVIAYKTGHKDMMEMLLDCTDEHYYYLFDEKGLNVLHYAVLEKDMPLIKLLIEKYDFDPFYTENGTDEVLANSPFSWAIFNCNFALVEYFLKKKGLQSERVNICAFSLDETVYASDTYEHDENTMELDQLAEIFGGDEIVALLKQYKK